VDDDGSSREREALVAPAFDHAWIVASHDARLAAAAGCDPLTNSLDRVGVEPIRRLVEQDDDG
jgi:hypothetical protein